MTHLTKKAKLISEKIEHGKVYDFASAVQILKDLPAAKFKESLEVSVNLGVDAKKSDQTVRGATVLPHGTGKSVRVAVFTQGDKVEAAKEAGADVVGMDDLLKQIQDGDLNFDVVIASPDAMGVVGRLGQILGPRGLMPNPKVGTVTPDVARAVKNAKSGQVRYRTDKNGILHFIIGKIDFEINALQENLSAVLADIKRLKPSTAKGQYIKSIFVATTMGPGLSVEAVKDRGGQ